uniref:Secreted protein n=1 Tax=Opuntia streptacantha TaxID=393608 RepID=A0A7C9CN91_OPUST
MCLGTIRVFLLSLAAFPANSKTSAARYSRTAARYTGAPAPTRSAYFPAFRNRAMRPTGNCKPALLLRDVAFFAAPEPRVFPLPAIFAELFVRFLQLNISPETKRPASI